jgi:antitoxin component of MazEF toxin-antitoxin module
MKSPRWPFLECRRLTKQGGSLVLRIPRAVLRARGWKLGDYFVLDLEGDGLLVRKICAADVARAFRLTLDRLRRKRKGE